MRKQLSQTKRGELPSITLLTEGAVGVLILGLIVVVVLVILGQIGNNTTLAPVNSAAANAITSTSTAVAQIPTWFAVLITVIVAVALILLVMVLRQVSGHNNG